MRRNRQLELYVEAQKIAYLAMGLRDEPRRRGDKKCRHKADDDPLAWWCLVESIVGAAERFAGRTR